MIYTTLTKKAMKIAYKAHHGQVDAGGDPYVFHAFHLAEQMQEETTVCAALLHDVLEDTEMTLEELQKDFPQEVTEIVSLLTREPKEDYFDYIRRIQGHSGATTVKLADLNHNSDMSRLAGAESVSEKRKDAWREKYERARVILTEDKPKDSD